MLLLSPSAGDEGVSPWGRCRGPFNAGPCHEGEDGGGVGTAAVALVAVASLATRFATINALIEAKRWSQAGDKESS